MVGNPFEPVKKKTVKRDAKDVYGGIRDSINQPHHDLFKPLDRLFHEIEENLKGKYTDFAIDQLYQKLYQQDSEDKRYLIIKKLLEYLEQIQRYSIEEAKNHDKNLIVISLYDMRTLGKLINLIIIMGIYPALNVFGVGIPLEKRFMNEFTRSKGLMKIPRFPLPPQDVRLSERILSLVYDYLFQIFSIESDVRDLLMKGTGFSDFLTVCITLISAPFSNDKQGLLQDYQRIELIGSTFELYLTYTLLVGSPSPAFFKKFLMSRLKVLPFLAPRGDGVLTLIEFVLGLRDLEEVKVERFDSVANVLILKPQTIDDEEYYTSIFTQFYKLLVNINRPAVTSCVGYIIEKMYGRTPELVELYLFKKIWEKFNPEGAVGEVELNNNVNVVLSLMNKGLSSEICQHLMRPILLPLWSYFTYCQSRSNPAEVIKGILVSYVTVSNGNAALFEISQNLMFESYKWEFSMGPNGLIQISERQVKVEDKELKVKNFLGKLDSHCKYFIDFLKDIDDDLIQSLFMRIMRRWLKNDQLLEENPYLSLVDLRVLEAIGKEFGEVLARTPGEMLELVKEVLSSNGIEASDDMEEDSDDEDPNSEMLPVVLEIISLILSEDSLKLDDHARQTLKDISTLLDTKSDTSNALRERILMILEGEKPTNSVEEEQKKTLKRAIVSLNDPLAPIRAHGLHLLRQLVESCSSIITLDFALELHLVQLKDPEPFIYLNAIRGLEKFIEWDPLQVVKRLAGLYETSNLETTVKAEMETGMEAELKAEINSESEELGGSVSLDEKLRIGEVLLRFIQNHHQILAGPLGEVVVGSGLQVVRSKQDSRLRMSALSLLGVCCQLSSFGIQKYLAEVIDCAIGVLQLEKEPEAAILRRAAVVVLNDLIIGTADDSSLVTHKSKTLVFDTLNYISGTDSDILVREQALETIKMIDATA